MNFNKIICTTILASVAIIGCKDKPVSELKEIIPNKGIDISLLDKSISPNQDFFQFINGTWLKNNSIPDDRTRWGSFDELRKMTDDDMLAILKKAMNDENLDMSSDQGKAVLLYKSIMDLEARKHDAAMQSKEYDRQANLESKEHDRLSNLDKAAFDTLNKQ